MPHRMFSVGEWFAGARQPHSLFNSRSVLRSRRFIPGSRFFKLAGPVSLKPANPEKLLLDGFAA